MNINETIPPELLVLILDYIYADAIVSIPLAPSTPPPLDHHPLLDMMLVCRSWHQVIMSTPVFWTFIWIGAGIGPQSLEARRLKGLLGRSGQLPLSVMIAPERMERTEHFHTAHEALRGHFQQVETLSLVSMDKKTENMPSAEDIQQLLQHPLPSLKRLNVGGFYISLPLFGQSIRLEIWIDSPQLQELSCHHHFIFPKSPLHLISISLTLDFSTHLSLIPNSIDLPLLLELRLTRCKLGTLLSAFITPSLRRLFVDADVSRSPTRPELRPYPKLEELQWIDKGPDPTFSALLPLCPNLIRYSNYLVGDEENIELQHIDTPAAIIGLLSGEPGDNHAPMTPSWPKLEEILLDVGQCDDISVLVDAIPSLKRIRILQNFATRSDEETRQREATLLPSLREMVDIAFWLDPWGSNLGMHFEATEGV